jgi:hypothetical protein
MVDDLIIKLTIPILQLPNFTINKETLEFENLNYLEYKNLDKYIFYTDDILKDNNYDNSTINKFYIKLLTVANRYPSCKEIALDFRITMFVE